MKTGTGNKISNAKSHRGFEPFPGLFVVDAKQSIPHQSTNRTRSLLQLWHLCSLDAPSVASAWTAFIAHQSHIRLPWTTLVSMFLVVWMLYAVDRLIDARAAHRPGNQLEARHYFHRDHQSGFLAAIVTCSLVLPFLLSRFSFNELRLFSSLGALLFGYFFLIHMWPANSSQLGLRIPKECAVGIFFSAACFIPTVAQAPSLAAKLMPIAILFGLLCTLNCLFVYAWEHPNGPNNAHWSTRLASRHLGLTSTLALALSALLFASHTNSDLGLLPVACGIGFLCLLWLHRNQTRFSRLALRTYADLALLMPFPILAFFLPHK